MQAFYVLLVIALEISGVTSRTLEDSSSCFDSCDFESNSLCNFSSAINNFTLQLWNSDIPVPQPASGLYFILNVNPDKAVDLDMDLSCDSGASKITFKAYISMQSSSETALEFIGSPSGITIFQYGENATGGWQDVTVEVHPQHKASKVFIQSRLDGQEDLIALDDFCIIPCCSLFCDWETGLCKEWVSIIQPFKVQNYEYHPAGLLKPTFGSYYQINPDKLLQKDSRVELPCKSGFVNFKLAVQQLEPSQAALQLILSPSGRIIYGFVETASTNGWEDTPVRFDITGTEDTIITFMSTLLNENEFVAIDDICFYCDAETTSTVPHTTLG